jgi:hypothetical protein
METGLQQDHSQSKEKEAVLFRHLSEEICLLETAGGPVYPMLCLNPVAKVIFLNEMEKKY